MTGRSPRSDAEEENSSEEGITEREVGQATIVYEDPDGERAEKRVENDGIAYFQDHWIVRTGETDEGHDTVRRIPNHRVYYVERDVEEFKQEVRSLRNQVQSLASEVKEKFSSGESDRDDRIDGRNGR
jgi:hypothetical protein